MAEGRNLLAATVVSGHGLKHLYSAAFSIVLPEIKSSLALSNVAASALVTTRDISSGLVTLPAGFVADRFSNRWAQFLGVSMVLISVGYLLSGALQRYWVIVLAVILVGLGTSLWHPVAIASLSQRFPGRRGFALSLHGAGGNAGEVLGPLIAGGALLAISWGHLLQISFLPVLLAAGLVWLALRELKGQQGVSSVQDYLSAARQMVRSRVLMLVVLMSSMRSMSAHIMTTFLPIYLREDLDYSTFVVGVYVSLLQAVGIVTHPIIGFVSDRYGRKVALVPGMMFFGLLCVALAFADPGVQFTLVVLAIGVFMFTFHAIFIAAAIDISPEGVHGTSVALIYAGALAIGAVGSVTAGVLADAFSVKATFIYAGIVVIVAALGLSMVRVPKMRPVVAGAAEK